MNPPWTKPARSEPKRQGDRLVLLDAATIADHARLRTDTRRAIEDRKMEQETDRLDRLAG
ncbi:MAG: hypothetical protein ACXU8N_07065 [Telluria sp.]